VRTASSRAIRLSSGDHHQAGTPRDATSSSGKNHNSGKWPHTASRTNFLAPATAMCPASAPGRQSGLVGKTSLSGAASGRALVASRRVTPPSAPAPASLPRLRHPRPFGLVPHRRQNRPNALTRQSDATALSKPAPGIRRSETAGGFP